MKKKHSEPFVESRVQVELMFASLQNPISEIERVAILRRLQKKTQLVGALEALWSRTTKKV